MHSYQENNLTKTLRALQAESSVCLNTIDNLDNLMSDINHGRWEAVMPQVRKHASATRSSKIVPLPDV